MKKILISILIVNILCSCSFIKKEEVITTITPLISDNPTETTQPEQTSFQVDTVTLYNGEFETSWYLYDNYGSSYLNNTYNNIHVDIGYSGTNRNDLNISRQGIPLLNGHSYIINFSGSSNQDKQITMGLSNGDNSIVSYDIDLSSQENSYRYQFEYSGQTTYDALWTFNCGGNDQYNETMDLSNVLIMDITSDNHSVKVNQVGYKLQDNKRALFSYNEGDFFNVINVNTQAVVYSGAIICQGFDVDSQDTVYYGDFTDLKEPGTYQIQTQIGGTSYTFVISENPYQSLIESVLYTFYIQRCGQSVNSYIEGYSHDICHNTTIIGPDLTTTFTINGGWHDAGDYGRYSNTGAKAVLDLLLSYQINPSLFTDSTGISESGNGVADILDEAKYELDWLLSMVTDDGGVYSKITTQTYADHVNPQDDSKQLYLYDVRTDISASVGAVFAYASKVFASIDESYSQQLLQTALLCGDFISNHSEQMISDTVYDGFTQGIYDDNDDSDQRFFLYSALYYATCNSDYFYKAIDLLNNNIDITGTSWSSMGGYGLYFLAKSDLSIASQSQLELIQLNLNEGYLDIANAIVTNGYSFSHYDYQWGSNAFQCNDVLYLALLDQICDDQNIKDIATNGLHYILGRNSLNLCYVIGFGSNSPQTLHHRQYITSHLKLIGAMVGGSNASCDDPVSQQYKDTLPIAKYYFDDSESYSTNETSIYYNSALLASLAILSKN